MPNIVYTFQGAGADSVTTSFDKIDERAKRSRNNAQKGESKANNSQRRQARRRAQEIKRDWKERVKAAERGAAAELRAEQKAEKNRTRQQRKLRRNRARNRLRRMRDNKREADQQLRLQKQQQAREQRGMQQRQKDRSRMFRGAAFGVAGAAVGALGAGVAAIGVPAARQGLQLEDKARALAVQARGAGERGVDPRSLARDLQQTAIRVGGTTGEALLDAVSAFVTKTGKFQLGKAMAETFGTVARATGADAQDIAGAAADLFEKFDIKTIDDMQEAMATLTFQGKKGAFELSDAAAQFPRLAAAASRLGLGKGVTAVKQLGGLTQIARQATGSPEAAATALEAVFTSLTTKQADLKKAGVTVFDEKGKARNIEELLVDVISKVGGEDIGEKKGELARIFGRQGIRALSPLIAAYADATGDGAEKAKAVATALEGAINAPGTWADVVEDAAIMNEGSAARMTTAWASIVAGAQENLVPALADMATTIGVLLEGGGFEAIASAFDVAAENIAFLGDVAEAAADALKEIGVIKPNISKDIEKSKREEARFSKRAEAKIAAKQPILAKVRAGTAGQADLEKLGKLDQDIQGLLSKRDVAGKRARALEAKRDKPLQQATTVERGLTTETFFTPKQFEDAMVEAAQLSGFEKAIGGESRERARAQAIMASLQRGENVPTFGLAEGQRAVVGELGGQLEAQRQGIGGQAPEGAIMPTEATRNFSAAVLAATAALDALAQQNRADVGG